METEPNRPSARHVVGRWLEEAFRFKTPASCPIACAPELPPGTRPDLGDLRELLAPRTVHPSIHHFLYLALVSTPGQHDPELLEAARAAAPWIVLSLEAAS